MKRPIPTFKTDKEAEDFVAMADLSDYDLSGGEIVRFEMRPPGFRDAFPKSAGLMKKPGLDSRHRHKDDQIQRKRSDTMNKNLSKPIPQFSPEMTLGEMRRKTGKISEADVRRAAARMAKK
jgi:hypothetical protein